MNEPIQPVIAYPPSQSEQAIKLVQYCFELDGTTVVEIPVDDSANTIEFPKNSFACRAAYSLRCAANFMEGRPFILIEADSVPTMKDWARILTDEYYRLGNLIMISSDTHPPFDLVGGIGVYPPHAAKIIPKDFEKDGWDMFLIKEIPHLVSQTHLIQHHYGIYAGEDKVVHVLRFPEDLYVIRPSTVIFHRDKHQDLLQFKGVFPKKQWPEVKKISESSPLKSWRGKLSTNRFLHTGDMGDIIAALPSIRQLGGGELVITPMRHDNTARESMKGARFDFIKPLLEAQAYISSVRFEDDAPKTTPVQMSKQQESITREARAVARSIGLLMDNSDPEEVISKLKGYALPNVSPILQKAIKDGFIVPRQTQPENLPDVTHNFRHFRSSFKSPDESLAHWQARYLGIDHLNTDPWITVQGSDKTKGRVVVTRTLRYRNPEFDWNKVLQKYGDRIVFIGLNDEYSELQAMSATPIDRLHAGNMLEMATFIKGADLLVCNQSCAFWLAAGMGTAIVQETWPLHPNSMIPRDNAIYHRTAADEY